MKTQTYFEYVEEIHAQGVPLNHIAMVCPMCGTVQSGQDLIDSGAGEDLESVNKYLGFSCVGRWTHQKSPPKTPGTQIGCNWTLGGLFKMHKLEVINPDGNISPRFELAEPYQAQEHMVEYLKRVEEQAEAAKGGEA